MPPLESECEQPEIVITKINNLSIEESDKSVEQIADLLCVPGKTQRKKLGDLKLKPREKSARILEIASANNSREYPNINSCSDFPRTPEKFRNRMKLEKLEKLPKSEIKTDMPRPESRKFMRPKIKYSENLLSLIENSSASKQNIEKRRKSSKCLNINLLNNVQSPKVSKNVGFKEHVQNIIIQPLTKIIPTGKVVIVNKSLAKRRGSCINLREENRKNSHP